MIFKNRKRGRGLGMVAKGGMFVLKKGIAFVEKGMG